MQSLADGVRADAFDRRHRLVDDPPVRRMERLEIHFAAGRSHFLREDTRLVRELRFAATTVLPDIDTQACIGPELARGKPSQDVLESCESLPAAADQEAVHRAGANGDLDFFDIRTNVDLGGDSHRRQQILGQLAQVGVLGHQSLDANSRRTLAKQAQEPAARIVENVDPNLSGFRSQCGQGGP